MQICRCSVWYWQTYLLVKKGNCTFYSCCVYVFTRNLNLNHTALMCTHIFIPCFILIRCCSYKNICRFLKIVPISSVSFIRSNISFVDCRLLCFYLKILIGPFCLVSLFVICDAFFSYWNINCTLLYKKHLSRFIKHECSEHTLLSEMAICENWNKMWFMKFGPGFLNMILDCSTEIQKRYLHTNLFVITLIRAVFKGFCR